MIATLNRSGTTYATANKRYFDVWGGVEHESGLGTNPPSQRYCANLGHVEDDESDLIYMRARYYEPWTGRLISEDPDKNGVNWYLYCNSNPVDFADESGQSKHASMLVLVGFMIGLLQELLESYENYGIQTLAPAFWKACLWAAMSYGVAFAAQHFVTDAMGAAPAGTTALSGGIAAVIIFLTARYVGMIFCITMLGVFDDIFLNNMDRRDLASQSAWNFFWDITP